MKALWTIPTLAALCAATLLVSPLYSAASAPAQRSKLDKFIEPIAEAADEQRLGASMNRALLRQAIRANSPLEARWNEAGAVQVYLRYAAGGAGPDLAALKALGATGIVKSDALKLVQAWVPAEELRAAGDLPGVGRVTLPHYAYHMRTTNTGRLTNTGSVDTQGDTLLGASEFRSLTGITGQGITVGVISDGDDHIASSQKSGDLPANIVNDPNDAGSFKSSGDEGTAMMEIVYDLAPGVKQLGFCGPGSAADYLTCLSDFEQNIGANVIVDDLGFQGGAMFSDDDFNTAVKGFADDNPKVHLVTSAGNYATQFWQGTWTPASLSPAVMVNGVSYTQAQNFGTANYLIIDTSRAMPGDQLSYQVEWNDPWSDDANTPNDPNDYDVVVFDNPNASSSGGVGNSAVACNQGTNVGPPTSGTLCNQHNTTSTLNTPGPQPIQGSAWTVSHPGTAYYLEVFMVHGTPGSNIKILVVDNTTPVPIIVTPATTGSVFGHATLSEVTATGAFDAQAPLYSIEPFSSTGPVEYGVTNGTSTTVTNPQSIQKPDFAAPDDVSVTGAGGFENPFFGTSAAAPHIAGLIALLMAGYPNQSPYTLLQDAATQPGSPDPNGTFGFGVPIMTTLLSKGMYPVPAAAITAPASGTTVSTGQATAFTGSCTADQAAGSVKYDWNFGSGSGIADSNQTNPSVTFNTAGTFTVTLTCSDSNGKGTASVGVTVNAPSKGGGDLDLLALSGLGLIYLARRRRIRS